MQKILLLPTLTLSLLSHSAFGFFGSKPFKIAAVGDILIHEALRNQSQRLGYSALWSNALPYIKSANIAYGNMEGPSVDSLAPQSEEYSFNFPEILSRTLKSDGFDIVSTANNHSLDRGIAGVIGTINTLNKNGLSFVGTRTHSNTSEGFYKILQSAGVRTAWISCTDVKNSGSSELVADCSNNQKFLSNLIGEMKTKFKADIVIVTPHWGEEKISSPSGRQQRLARYFFQSGADLVIGAHPHVMQRAESYVLTDNLGQTKNRLVYYSLGNFVSNQLNLSIPQKASVVATTYFRKGRSGYEVNSYDAVPLSMEGYPLRLEVVRNKNSPVYGEILSTIPIRASY